MLPTDCLRRRCASQEPMSPRNKDGENRNFILEGRWTYRRGTRFATVESHLERQQHAQIPVMDFAIMGRRGQFMP